MKKQITILSISLLLFSSKAFTQSSSENPHKWGIEAELIQPFLPEVGILRLQMSRVITSKSDFLLGMYLRPNVKHDVVEKINEYMLILGYRHYLWKGLHLEGKANIGYAWGSKNLIDGKDYQTTTLFWESNLGYKFNLTNNTNSSIYVIPQFGIIGNAQSANSVNIGPRGGKADTFIQGSLLVGINF
jgi:hypothetical protein